MIANLSIDKFLKTVPVYEVIHINQNPFIEKALRIHSLISIELAKCPHIQKEMLRKALSLIDELDSILGSTERISRFYSDRCHALLEILKTCGLAKKIEHQINKDLKKLRVASKNKVSINSTGEKRMNKQHRRRINSTFFVILFAFLTIFIVTDPSFAVTIVRLQEPIISLKSEIFGGWMMVVKIAAAAAGIVLSVFRGSLAPFGIGAGISAGIILFDKYLGTGADGALI